MATVAEGRNCPNCGTLVTCTGLSTDTTLIGACPVDGTVVTTQHVRVEEIVPGPGAIAEPTEVTVQPGDNNPALEGT